MKRHILGLTIFSIIIVAAILFKSAFLMTADNNFSPELISDYSPVKKKSYCRFSHRAELPVVKQAFLDYDTKRIDWQIYVPQTDAPIALHLFAKNADGEVHLVATEVMPIKGVNQVVKYSTVYTALSNFSPDESLYVVPETVSREAVNTMYFDPKFDENSAVPVTVFSARNIHNALDK